MPVFPRIPKNVDSRLSSMEAKGAEFDALVPAIQSIPTPASSAPPGVGVASARGSQTAAYALANHTHATSVQRKKIAVPVAGVATTVTWTFDTAYAAGISPVCTATVENAAGATQPYVVNMSGPASNTAVTFIVYKAGTVTLPGLATSLLGFLVNIFGGSVPVGVTVNCQAGIPTQ